MLIKLVVHTHQKTNLRLCRRRVRLGPLARVLEQPQPRRGAVGVEPGAGRVVRELPREEAALGVRHHRQVAAVGAAHGGDAERRAVGVEGVRLGRRARRVDVAVVWLFVVFVGGW